jgi:hypothetical protein
VPRYAKIDQFDLGWFVKPTQQIVRLHIAAYDAKRMDILQGGKLYSASQMREEVNIFQTTHRVLNNRDDCLHSHPSGTIM